MTRIPDAGNDPVCEFYTDHPYPPPVDNLDRAREEWRDPNRTRAEFHLFWPDQPQRDDLEILVAGCGTWQAAKYALCRPNARVVGIDVSPTSLDHTERLQRQYGLTNLETRQLAIEDAAALGRQFDLIVCTGVLHHLADPEAGLRALRRALKPAGALYLMVYARYGRSGISMLQEYCRTLGLSPSEQDVNDLRTALKLLPSHHPATAALSGSRDLADADALADALLNPRERAYSVPELFELIEHSGLSFGRWYWQAPYLPGCGMLAASSHARRLLELPVSDQYAAVELWRGTMTAHSVVLHRDHESNPGTGAGPGDAHWDRSVPIRLPSTLCVQERLPPGAAGVLLNRSHPFHDLILPIDADQKRMFDQIDGRRTLADISERVGGPSMLPLVHAFFEELWRYDQLVFDRSLAGLGS